MIRSATRVEHVEESVADAEFSSLEDALRDMAPGWSEVVALGVDSDQRFFWVEECVALRGRDWGRSSLFCAVMCAASE